MLRESGGMPGGMPGAAPGAGLFGAPPPNANPPANPPPGSTGANPPFNPSLWPPFPQPNQAAGTGTGTGAGSQAPGIGAGVIDPALIQQILGGLGSGAGGGLAGLGATQQPADSRSPEERFQVQLQVRYIRSVEHGSSLTISTPQQLQDMGFVNASQNIRALLATGGNVHSAIEYILSGGGI
jgi:ubiquilin